MIGNILNNNLSSSSSNINLDDYFDSVTHTTTEENFINFLNKKYYTNKVIGYKVTINNTANQGTISTYTIADVDHDDYFNTYDLISDGCINYLNSKWDYRGSDARTWLNNSYYNSFSNNFRSHITKISYNCKGTIYSDDYITIPSATEIGHLNASDHTADPMIEGTKYPILTGINNFYERYYKTNYQSWMTRSSYSTKYYPYSVVEIASNLGPSSTSPGSACGVVSLFRVS